MTKTKTVTAREKKNELKKIDGEKHTCRKKTTSITNLLTLCYHKIDV